MGVKIAILRRILGIFKPKRKTDTQNQKVKRTPIMPIPFDNSDPNERTWDINHNSGTIVSPLTNEIITHKVETKMVVDRRDPAEERRAIDERREGEKDRRKKKKFRFFNRRKNPWNRRSGQDRRFGQERRLGNADDVVILDKGTENVSTSYPNNIGKTPPRNAKKIINSSSLNDLQDSPARQRYEIRPQKMSVGENKNSSAIISSRIDVDNIDERILFGQTNSFKQGDVNINSLGEKTPVILEDGKKIANIYISEDTHYLEIFEGPFNIIHMQYNEDKSEIEFRADTQAVGIAGAITEHDINLIANNNIMIDLNNDHPTKIKIGSYKTFGF